MPRFVLLVLMLLASTVALADAGRAALVPFDIETYTPMTKDTFQISSNQDCAFAKSGVMPDLLKNARPSEGLFDEQRVRAMLQEDGVSVFVDARGVFPYKERAYLISESDLKSVIRRHFSCHGRLASRSGLDVK